MIGVAADSAAGIITATAALVAAIAAVLGVLRQRGTHRRLDSGLEKIDDVRAQVETSEDHTVGQVIEETKITVDGVAEELAAHMADGHGGQPARPNSVAPARSYPAKRQPGRRR